MQINTKVQIVMDQSDIEAAITAALYQQLPHLRGVELSIKLVAGRGESGHRAEIEGVHSLEGSAGSPEYPAQDQAEDAVTPSDKAEDKAPFDTSKPDSNPEEQTTPVQNQSRPVFRKAAQEATPESSPEPDNEQTSQPDSTPEEQPSASPRLFGRLARPSNK